MRVRLTTARVGNGFVQEAGQVVDLPQAEASRLVAARQAEPVDATPETAAQTPRETATRPTARQSGKPKAGAPTPSP